MADHCLNEEQVYHEYSQQALVDATIIFMHVISDFVWAYTKELKLDTKCYYAESLGKGIRTLLIDHIGFDMHDIVGKRRK